MIKKFLNLKLIWQIVIGVVLIFGFLWVTDSFLGGYSKLRSALFHSNEQQTMVEVQKLKDDNTKLELEKVQLKSAMDAAMKRAVEAESKNVIYENKDTSLSAEIVAEQVKTEKILKELEHEEAITKQPISAYERCVRIRAKSLERGLTDAKLINCDTYPK